MKLLIEIPDEQYEYIKKSDKNTFAAVASKECMLYAIKNGIPYDTSGDLISRSALKKALHDRYAFWGDLTKYEILMSAMFETFNKLIDNAPTVTNGTYEQGFRVGAYGRLDEIRPKGEWIKKTDEVGFVSHICSECGAEIEVEDCSDDKFCFNCGAKMKAVKKNDL